MSKRVFDSSFKRMAVELSYARGSVKEAAIKLGVDPCRISKWRQQQHGSAEKSAVGLTEEQKEIRRLQKELKEVQLERDILKKAVKSSRTKGTKPRPCKIPTSSRSIIILFLNFFQT